MSSSIVQSMSSAMTYNKKSASSLGWLDSIPCDAISAYPNLACSPSSEEFALAVMAFQEDTFGSESGVDGKLGRGTWSAILKKFDRVDDSAPFWTVNDRRVNVDVDDAVDVVNFDQSGGLDLHRFGHFSARSRRPHLIVVHWGGLDPHHCYRVFSNPDRKVSSHAGIGLSPDGNPTIYQYLDLNHKSWHAGWANSYSVGIDICQQPDLKWKNHYLKKSYDVRETVNPTDRGSSKILSIDPRVALAVREAVKSLCDVLDIPYDFPRNADGSVDHDVQDKDYLINGFSGVIGHHHITKKKWDCACWWSDIFNEEDLV